MDRRSVDPRHRAICGVLNNKSGRNAFESSLFGNSLVVLLEAGTRTLERELRLCEFESDDRISTESLILAQDERWRRA